MAACVQVGRLRLRTSARTLTAGSYLGLLLLPMRVLHA